MEKETLDYKFFKYSLFTFLMFLSAINYNMFINPTKTVAGGTNGVSIILEKLFNFTPSKTIFIISFIIILVAFMTKHYEEMGTALYAAVIYPFFVTITKNVEFLTEFKTEDMFIAVVFSGIIYGFVSGITSKLKMSQGGTILISQIVSDYFNTPLSKTNFTINLVVVLAGGTIFGVRTIIYALIYLFVSKIIIEKITTETSKNKMFQIITTEDKRVKEFIYNVIGAGCTTFGARGRKNKKKTVIMTAVRNSDYFKLKEGIYSIDKDAFIVITDSYQVHGGK